jgi:hypothetical protein
VPTFSLVTSNLKAQDNRFADSLLDHIQRACLSVTTAQLGHGGHVVTLGVLLDDNVELQRKTLDGWNHLNCRTGNRRVKGAASPRRASISRRNLRCPTGRAPSAILPSLPTLVLCTELTTIHAVCPITSPILQSRGDPS